MYVIGKVKADSARRINVKILFDQLPHRLYAVADYKAGKIFFYKESEIPNSLSRTVDDKGRFTLPKWIIEEFGDEFFITDESLAKHYLLAKRLF